MKNTSLLSNQLEIILGGLLGDSSIRKNTNQINFGHSEKQFEYLSWKHNELKSISTNITKVLVDNKYIRYNFETLKKVSEEFKFISLLIFDKFGKKRVNRKWLNQLTPLSLAIWWMDDGCLSIHKGNRYGKLCTHCFSYEEHEIMKQYFKVKWDIDIQIKLEKNEYYFCRLNVENLKKLISIIYPYIILIPNMIYKIDLNYINNVNLGDFEVIYNIIKNSKLT